jgi:putative transcriptional regulator
MKKLKDLRKKNNLTYDDIANLLNISKTFYWQLENNKRRIFYKQAIAIAKIFNLKPDDIFYEELI